MGQRDGKVEREHVPEVGYTLVVIRAHSATPQECVERGVRRWDGDNGPSIEIQSGKILAARQEVMAGELKAFYLTIGQYDAVAIAELPDDAAVAKMALSLGAMGNVRTETLRAFNEAEFRKIVGELP